MTKTDIPRYSSYRGSASSPRYSSYANSPYSPPQALVFAMAVLVVASLAIGRPYHRISRPTELASNRTDGNELLLYEASCVPDADIYVQVLPTSPFLSSTTIDNAVFKLVTSSDYDSVFTVFPDRLYMRNKEGSPINYDPSKIPNSFELPDTIIETMGLYVIRREALLETRCRIGKSPHLQTVSRIEAIDINTEDDFKFAEAVIRGINNVL